MGIDKTLSERVELTEAYLQVGALSILILFSTCEIDILHAAPLI